MSKRHTALGLRPGRPGFILFDRPLADRTPFSVDLMPVAQGQCSTDQAVLSGKWLAECAPGFDTNVTGHESILQVVDIAGDWVQAVMQARGQTIEVGDYVFEEVRRPRILPMERRDIWLPSTNMMAAPIAPFFLPGQNAPWVEAGIGGADGGNQMRKRVDCRLLHVLPIGRDLPPWASPFIEPALALTKARKVGMEAHEVIKRRAGTELNHNKVIITGGTGAGGLLTTAMYVSAGYETWVIGRRDESDPVVKRLIKIGAKYHQHVLSPEADMNRWKDYLKEVSKRLGIMFDGKVGGARYLFDLSGNPIWAALYGSLANCVIDYAIPEGEFLEGSRIDGAELIRQRTVNNAVRIGSVNLDSANDFTDAVALVKWMVANHLDVLRAAVRPIDGLDIEALAAALNDDTVIKPIMFPNGLVKGGFVS